MTDPAAGPAPHEDGAVERVVEGAEESAREATTFVARLGGALSDGFRDGRERT